MPNYLAEPLTQRAQFLEALDAGGKDPAHFAALVDSIEALAEDAADADSLELRRLEFKLKVYKTSAEMMLKVAEAPPLMNFNIDSAMDLNQAQAMLKAADEEERTIDVPEAEQPDLGDLFEFHVDQDAMKTVVNDETLKEKAQDLTGKADLEWCDVTQSWIEKQKKRIDGQG